MRIIDCSSDVCSSDLELRGQRAGALGRDADRLAVLADRVDQRFHRPNRALAVGAVDEDGAAPFHQLAEDGDVADFLLPHRAHVTANELGEDHHVRLALMVEDEDAGARRPEMPLVLDLQLDAGDRSEEHTSEFQSLMRISYAVFCLKKKKTHTTTYST